MRSKYRHICIRRWNLIKKLLADHNHKHHHLAEDDLFWIQKLLECMMIDRELSRRMSLAERKQCCKRRILSECLTWLESICWNISKQSALAFFEDVSQHILSYIPYYELDPAKCRLIADILQKVIQNRVVHISKETGEARFNNCVMQFKTSHNNRS
jgi:hypothetical protein